MSDGYVEWPDEYDSYTNWRVFKRGVEMDVYVKDDSVVCVACFEGCTLDGVCLIDMSPSELVVILGCPDEIGEAVWVSEDRRQVPYEYFSLGLQIWFEADKVVSVFCNATY
ncbi:hypothetical protein GCM10007907_06990 [Chitinimonas prasina]|uniref:Uncharacterized protein n=1 Tax=Chitinimonas prasina TaxID=1434937 RepID=A0ABQ5YG70_9NEIS|nr:hypothetical protein [Chitinimonas prasina]GLR11909.1 hypothetical protein GCM10007907_06990 [Chitinimonas prasina]